MTQGLEHVSKAGLSIQSPVRLEITLTLPVQLGPIQRSS